MNRWRDFIETNTDDVFKKPIELIIEIESDDVYKYDDISLLREMINNIEKEKIHDKEKIKNLNSILKMFEDRREKSISVKFGEFIKKRRNDLSMTLSDLADITGVSQSYLSRLELAQRSSPSIIIIEKIAKGLCLPFFDVARKAGIDLGIDESNLLSISHFIKINNVSLKDNDAKLTDSEKDVLIGIIDHLSNIKWQERKRLEESKLLMLVDAFKENNYYN